MSEKSDPLFEKAALLIVATDMACTSKLQRFFNIVYTRANLLMNQLEKAGIVGPPNGGKPRKILKSKEEVYIQFQTSDWYSEI